MVDGMVIRGLQQANLLQKGDNASILLAGLVRPFLDLIGVGADDGKEPQLPRQYIEPPCDEDNHRREAQQVPRTLPPVIKRHVAG